MVSPYLMHRRKAFRDPVATLLAELAAAAVSAGGTGLADWAIWLADAGTTNQGGIGGNLSAPGATPGTTTNAVGGRSVWTFNGSTQYWQFGATSTFNTDTQTSFCLCDPVGTAGTQVIWRHCYGQGTGVYQQDHGMLLDSGSYIFQARSSGGAAINSSATGSTNIRLLSGVWASDTVQGYQDGTANGSALSGATLTPSQHLNGRIGTNVGTAGVWFSGNIGCLAICISDLNSAASGSFGTARERAAAAINTYYGR